MKKIFLIFLLALSSCASQKEKNQPESLVVNLSESVKIIRHLVAQNKLGALLEEHDPEQLEILLNNFSPAQMAFESEVLSTTVPQVAVYYYKNTPEAQRFIQELNTLATAHEDRVKFVIVDADTLFSLAQDAEIEDFPTIVMIKNREIVSRIANDVTINHLKKNL